MVDSGSTDATVKVAQKYGAKVFLISPDEFNHGTTRNYGAEHAHGDLLVFMVQDAIPATADLFSEMANKLRADRKLAGVSARQIPKSYADIYACWEIWNHYRFLFQSPPPDIGDSDNLCSMVRREIGEKHTYKPTSFAEDLEFGISCVREGYRIGTLRRENRHGCPRASYPGCIKAMKNPASSY